MQEDGADGLLNIGPAHALLHVDERNVFSGTHEPPQLDLSCALEQLEATRLGIEGADGGVGVATLAFGHVRQALDQLAVPLAIARGWLLMVVAA